MSESKQPQTMPETEWNALGARLFGADLTKWRFRCPTCGSVMSIEKARKMPPEQLTKLRELKWNIEQECIGRYVGAGCDWCAYGLFSGPFFVVRDSGSKTPVFGFDMPGHSPPAEPTSDPADVNYSSCANGSILDDAVRK